MIPDLLIGVWADVPNEGIRHRLTALECHVLALAEQRGGLTTDTLREVFRLRSERGAEVLAKLSRKRLLRDENNRFELTVGAATSTMKIIAIEAKLCKWRTALTQASSYLEFANSAWVVLDRNQCKITPAIHAEFLSNGIGLALLSGPIIEVLARPDQTVPVSGARWIAASKLGQAKTAIP
ncbi:MAG TPA: hypothetical protein VF006_00245 [Longimicrobium sp.]